MSSPTSTPKLIYLNLPVAARGGALRFFMLSNNIDFTEDLIDMKDWPARKAELIKSGANPAGNVPIIELDGKVLTQHVSTMRYLAKLAGKTSGDDYGDYVQDLVADEYQNWRNVWVATAFQGGDKDVYKTETLPEKLTIIEGYYNNYKTGKSPFLSVSPSGAGLWGDSAVAGLLWDNIQTGLLDEEILDKYPNLSALYKTYIAQPPVAAWIASKAKKE
jgi:glutathione S-transferase